MSSGAAAHLCCGGRRATNLLNAATWPSHAGHARDRRGSHTCGAARPRMPNCRRSAVTQTRGSHLRRARRRRQQERWAEEPRRRSKGGASPTRQETGRGRRPAPWARAAFERLGRPAASQPGRQPDSGLSHSSLSLSPWRIIRGGGGAQHEPSDEGCEALRASTDYMQNVYLGRIAVQL